MRTRLTLNDNEREIMLHALSLAIDHYLLVHKDAKAEAATQLWSKLGTTEKEGD